MLNDPEQHLRRAEYDHACTSITRHPPRVGKGKGEEKGVKPRPKNPSTCRCVMTNPRRRIWGEMPCRHTIHQHQPEERMYHVAAQPNNQRDCANAQRLRNVPSVPSGIFVQVRANLSPFSVRQSHSLATYLTVICAFWPTTARP